MAAARGLVVAHDVGTKLWQDLDSAEMKLHAEWLLRVYGDELARPAMQAAPTSSAAGTLELIERLLAEKDQPGHVLFSPGPVMTSARVKASLVHYDVCHRDGDYAAVVGRLQEKLRPAFGASPAHEMLLLTGSGTAAMEMSIASVVPPGKKLLVIANGAFGDRLDEIAALHGIPRVMLRYRWGELPSARDVARALDGDADIAAVAMIHHETSVGLLNPVGDVGRLCRARGVTLVVDAVSALGGEDVDVVRDGVDICFSSANKCLHSVSGVSFLCVAPEVWPRIAGITPRVYYLDLARHRQYLTELRQTPFTPAVSSFFALETALDELYEQGGVPARRELYRKRNARIRRLFTDLGFESFSNTGRESHTISMLRLPDGLSVDALYDGLKARGFIIYRAKGELADRHVQVSNMGELPDATIDAFLAAVTEVVRGARTTTTAAAPRAQIRVKTGRDARRALPPPRRARGHGGRRRADAHARAGRGAGARQRRGDEPHRSVVAAGAARAARSRFRTSRAATCAASSRSSAPACARCRTRRRAIGSSSTRACRAAAAPPASPGATPSAPTTRCWASRRRAGRPSTSSSPPPTWCRRRARACRSTTPSSRRSRPCS